MTTKDETPFLSLRSSQEDVTEDAGAVGGLEVTEVLPPPLPDLDLGRSGRTDQVAELQQ